MSFPTRQDSKLSKTGKAYRRIPTFWYPSKLHERTEYPPAFTSYRHYKPFLKSEFGGRCVYCRKSDYDQDPGAFHVEHYRPKNLNQFPKLINEYANLFYACAACNRFKGNYWNDEKSKKVLKSLRSHYDAASRI